MKKHRFLLEIGVEELPPKLIRFLAESLLKNIKKELNILNIKFKNIFWFATPRRIAIIISSLNNYQNDNIIEKKGPKIEKSFNENGTPTLLLIKWANNNNININYINKYIKKNNKNLILKKRIKGKLVNTLIYEIIKKSISKIEIQKKMYWGNEKISFIRPVHNIIMLLDNIIINKNILGIRSNRLSYGHRFMGEKKIIIDNVKNYKNKLLEYGYIIVDYFKRKEKIIKEIKFNAKNLKVKINFKNNLLEEITSLVEWPVVLIGNFNKNYLSIPTDIISYVMEKNNKYIPIYNIKNKNIINKFIFIANIISKNPSKIIKGNEIVINSKLKDIKFFFKEDYKLNLKEHIKNLKNILFHKELGNYFNKTLRIKVLSSWIANIIGANIKNTIRSALLSKCDLITKMVFEFPEMQGIIGMYYSLYNNENKIVALSQKEQYQPRFSGDKLPTTKVSFSLAIADKIDTIVGIFGINKYPKGYKDPFALRRSALGIIRIIIENKLEINLLDLIKESVNLYGKYIINENVIINVIDFIHERFKFFYKEKGYNIDILKIIFSSNLKNKKLNDINNDIMILINIINSKEFNLILEIYKRIYNLLEKSKEINIKEIKIKFELIKEKEEIYLYKNIYFLENKIKFLLKNKLYKDIVYILYIILYIPINNFFYKIKIFSENINLRKNRLAILYKIYNIYLLIADFSLIKKQKIKIL